MDTDHIEDLVATSKKKSQGMFGGFFGGEEEDLGDIVDREREELK
jgi:hypothetical protein